MRIFRSQGSSAAPAHDTSLPVLFTGSAIAHLSAITTSIDISEWQWHEEFIEGRRTRIITDRLSATFDAGSPETA